MLRGFLIAPFLLLVAAKAYGGDLVEIVLQAELDEPRGYCLDIRGYKARAKPDRGLQAHSCYSYQGELGVDQAYSQARIEQGEFQLPGFGVCLTAASSGDSTQLALDACDGRSSQAFEFTTGGQIQPAATPTLCVTVADGESRAGGGGEPVHLIRRLTLEPCDEAKAAYQSWRMRARAD